MPTKAKKSITKQFECLKCGDIFDSYDKRKRHSKRKHQKMLFFTCRGMEYWIKRNERNNFACPICNKYEHPCSNNFQVHVRHNHRKKLNDNRASTVRLTHPVPLTPVFVELPVLPTSQSVNTTDQVQLLDDKEVDVAVFHEKSIENDSNHTETDVNSEPSQSVSGSRGLWNRFCFWRRR
jgi:hypothetical protein